MAVPTVKEYLMEWLRVYAEAHCKPSTAEGYRSILALHIFPILGDRRLSHVSRSDVKQLIASLVHAGLKRRTIHNILTPLKEAYQHAIDDGFVTTNPVIKMGRFNSSLEGADAPYKPLNF